MEPAPAEEAQAPSAHSLDDALRLWRRVERHFSESGSVVYSEAVQSLSSAHYYSRGSADARAFIDKCMARIVHVLLEQDPADLDKDDIECVEQALLRSLRIVAEDLDRIGDSGVCSSLGVLGLNRIGDNGVCKTLEGLKHMFMRAKNYYKEMNQFDRGEGPQLRRRMIAEFQKMHGFRNLLAYLNPRVNTTQFPDMSLTWSLLQAVHDTYIACPAHN
ncbi:hypothetical protein ACHAXT_000515 [Thalassiosira profunda]